MIFIRVIPFLLVIALVSDVHRGVNITAVWNAVPVLLGLGAFLCGAEFRGSGSIRHRALSYGCLTFGAVAAMLVTLFHLSWHFDWGGTASGSSTSAVAFLFTPLWFLLFAVIAGAVTFGIAYFVLRSGE